MHKVVRPIFCLITLVFTQLGFAEEPGRVLVVNTLDSSVSLVNLKEMHEVKKIKVGERPYGIAVSQDEKSIAVGVEGEKGVKFFDAANFKKTGFVKIGDMKNDHISLTPDGRYFMVANYHSDSVVAIDAKTYKIAFRVNGLSAPHVVKIGPKKTHAYVTCKKTTGLGIIDLKSNKTQFFPLNVNPRSLTFLPDESRVYFGSFWVDGFFEMEPTSGKVTRLIHLPPPTDNSIPQEVTYHGVEMVTDKMILAANEGRSFLDSVEVSSGKLLDRLTSVSKPCCVEHIPGSEEKITKALVSNLGDNTIELVSASSDGKLTSLGKIKVGNAPKRIAFLK